MIDQVHAIFTLKLFLNKAKYVVCNSTIFNNLISVVLFFIGEMFGYIL